MTEKQDNKVEKMDNEELEELAYRIANDEIFITNDPETLKTAFGFILGMLSVDNFESEEEWEEFAETIGAVYQDIEKAQKSVNGIPMFFSAKMLHVDQLDDLQEKIDEYNEKLNSIDPTQTVNDAM